MPCDSTGDNASAARFGTTRWSVVLAAQENGTTEGQAALEQLCRIYWKPLYAYLRRNSHSPSDAQDLVQGLFASLLERDGLTQVDRSRGKFRSFLLACLKHWVSKERDRAEAQKRGGHLSFVSLDELQSESQLPAAPELSPEEVYERRWAMAVIEQTIGRLREEYAVSARSELFTAIEPYLSGSRIAAPYAVVAARLNLSESGVKMNVQRMRRRFGELLREEVAQTVSRADEVDEEIRTLFASLRS